MASVRSRSRWMILLRVGTRASSPAASMSRAMKMSCARGRVVRWAKPTSIRSLDREEYHALPQFVTVRETRICVQQPDFRTRSIVVVTTLLDLAGIIHSCPSGRRE